MLDKPALNDTPDQTRIYQIKLEGHLGYEWTDWFEGLTITWAGADETVLTGPVVDQAALYGLLRKVRDLGLPLISIIRLQAVQANAVDS